MSEDGSLDKFNLDVVNDRLLKASFPNASSEIELDTTLFNQIKKAVTQHKIRPDTVRLIEEAGDTEDGEAGEETNGAKRALHIHGSGGTDDSVRGEYTINLVYDGSSWSSGIEWEVDGEIERDAA